MNIDKIITIVRGLEYLRHTVKTRSYTKTAYLCNTQQSNVSSRISEFEKILKVKLFSKAAHGMEPTYDGLNINVYAERFRVLLHELENYSVDTQYMRGNVEIWTTDGIGINLMPKMVLFQSTFPEVNLKVTATNDLPSFSTKQADIALVYRLPNKNTPVDMEEFNIKFALFATKEYIQKHGKPRSIDDLIENHYICDRNEYVNTWTKWDELVNRANHVIANIDSTNLLIHATRSGMGIALHPFTYGRMEPNWEHIDIGLNLEHKCWMLSHIDEKNNKMLQVLKQHIREVMLQL